MNANKTEENSCNQSVSALISGVIYFMPRVTWFLISFEFSSIQIWRTTLSVDTWKRSTSFVWQWRGKKPLEKFSFQYFLLFTDLVATVFVVVIFLIFYGFSFYFLSFSDNALLPKCDRSHVLLILRIFSVIRCVEIISLKMSKFKTLLFLSSAWWIVSRVRNCCRLHMRIISVAA